MGLAPVFRIVFGTGPAARRGCSHDRITTRQRGGFASDFRISKGGAHNAPSTIGVRVGTYTHRRVPGFDRLEARQLLAISSGSLTLTQAAISAGFGLMMFASGFPAQRRSRSVRDSFPPTGRQAFRLHRRVVPLVHAPFRADTTAMDKNNIYNVATKAVVFDSGNVAGMPDGITLGTGVLAGNLFANTNAGTLVEINLATDAENSDRERRHPRRFRRGGSEQWHAPGLAGRPAGTAGPAGRRRLRNQSEWRGPRNATGCESRSEACRYSPGDGNRRTKRRGGATVSNTSTASAAGVTLTDNLPTGDSSSRPPAERSRQTV